MEGGEREKEREGKKMEVRNNGGDDRGGKKKQRKINERENGRCEEERMRGERIRRR